LFGAVSLSSSRKIEQLSGEFAKSDGVVDLLEREAIRELKARYCRFLDLRDEKGWRAVFMSDVRMRTDLEVASTDGEPPQAFVVDGAARLVAAVFASLDGVATMHHCHTSEIALSSPTTATGIWAMEDRLIYSDGRELHGAGHYHETYDKSAGEWRIASLRLTRTQLKMVGDWADPTATE